MRRARFWLGAVVAGALALGVGCDDDDDDGNFDSVPGMPGQPDDPDSGTPPDLIPTIPDTGLIQTLSDAQIARVLQVANEGEVMLGQYAAPLATDQAVIDFNNQMVTEHTAVKQRLDALLAAEGITPEDSPLSLQLQSEVQQLMQVLQGPNAPAAGAALDLALLSAQLNAHARTAFIGDSLLTPQTTNAALQQELASERQAVQTHINEAADLQSAIVVPPVEP
ncbi:DUF4142 domain-containing protein [Corallococcus sp. CA054B]|uniref:DUF4142 domain-containing protein n=1 Tax=Corallococcus sp. CA054B TaxID=2316734 RepID=UPI000EA2D926|nr:DUF4142 domain-containing protein [Corallococcus sp. CA054B]RKG66164.1 DUF4142 domain-containing protein [Corallococcus sp. CA054B]